MSNIQIAISWVAAAIAAASVIFYVFQFRGVSARASRTLREILMARAEGRISQSEFEERQAALHGLVLESSSEGPARGLAWWALPVLCLGLAAYFGTKSEGTQSATHAAVPGEFKMTFPGAINLTGRKADSSQSPASATSPNQSGGDLREHSRKLAEKLASDPDNGAGWLLLARSYREIGDFSKAEEAFAKAELLLPPDASLLADWADIHVMNNNRNWDDKANALVKQALKTEPRHLKSLALAGSSAYSKGDFGRAADYWKRMLDAAPKDSMEAKEAAANLAEARSRMAGGNAAGTAGK